VNLDSPTAKMRVNDQSFEDPSDLLYSNQNQKSSVTASPMKTKNNFNMTPLDIKRIESQGEETKQNNHMNKDLRNSLVLVKHPFSSDINGKNP
jgi:hypothetical protein